MGVPLTHEIKKCYDQAILIAMIEASHKDDIIDEDTYYNMLKEVTI